MLLKKYTSYGEKPVFGLLARQTSILDNYPIHGHDHYEIEYVTGGILLNTMNGVETVMTPGDFYILSPDDLHRLDSITPRAELLSLCLHLPELTDKFTDFLISHKAPVTGTLPEEDRPFFESLIRQMIAERADSSPFVSEILYSCARLAISLLYRSNPTVRSREAAADEYVTQALRYVSTAYREHITLEETARQVGLSPNYFCTLFRRHAGCSFVEYLNILRVRKAQALLASDTEKSITEIAFEVGFGSYTNFYRAFCRIIGTPPGRFRDDIFSTEK